MEDEKGSGGVTPDIRRSQTLSTILKSFHSGSDIVRKASAILLRDNLAPSLLHKNFDAILTPDEPLGIEIYYYSGWDKPNLHYQVNEGEWSPFPGVPMAPPRSLTHLPIFQQDELIWHHFVPNASRMEMVPNFQGQLWDKTIGGGNYTVNTAGRYYIRHGQIQELLDPPERPALLCVNTIKSSEVTIAWNPPIIMASLVAQYKIMRDAELVATVGCDTLEYTDTNLFGLRKYSYVVIGVNKLKQEGKPSQVCEATTAEPGKASSPTDLHCVRHSTDSITIAWSEPVDHGGAPIKYFRIYREGVPLALVPAQTAVSQQYTDETVEANVKYEYELAALHHRMVESNASASQMAVKRMGSSIPDKVRDSAEGQKSEKLEVTAETMLEIPRLGDRKPHIILQTFNWQSCFNPSGWYRILASNVRRMSESCITMTWLPPPCESVSGQGYMPTRWYNLSSCYGSETELRTLLRNLRSQAIAPMVDLVINHRCGTKQDAKGEWTIFEDPPWENWAIVKNNLQGYEGSGRIDTGEQSECAPDIDHTNEKVKQDVNLWTKHLFNIGFAAVRIDMAPGYNVLNQVEYMRRLGNPFAVGEYWNGDVRVLENYVKGAKNMIAVFDFSLYYTLRHAIQSDDFVSLNHNGRPPGMIGINPDKSVTFLDNHDTEHLDFVGKFADGNAQAVLRGYAYLLTHCGTPSIYWNHWIDYGEEVYTQIRKLCTLRNSVGIHSGSGLHIAKAEQGLYAAFVSRDAQCGYGQGKLAVKIGTRDWSPGHDWEIVTYGEQYCVWLRS